MAQVLDGDARPKDLDAYRKWLKDTRGVQIDNRIKTRYETVVAKAKSDFIESAFWQEVVEIMEDIEGSYRIQAGGYPLFLGPGSPSVVTKPFDSFFLKTYRRNVLDNANWPDAPEDGWLVPDTWYSKLNDLVRTSLVVKYLDGVSFLAGKLADIAEKCKVDYELSLEARMEGHYAAHLCTSHEFAIPGEQWDTQVVPFSVEVQITTQLQEVIGRLLHRYYETRRALPARERPNWQWEYEGDEFIANYLGHILHYVEGMIMEVRGRQKTREVS